jgi:hypothetical protein
MSDTLYWQIRGKVEALTLPVHVRESVVLLSAIWPEHADDYAAGRLPFTGFCDLSQRIRAAIDAGRLP